MNRLRQSRQGTRLYIFIILSLMLLGTPPLAQAQAPQTIMVDLPAQPLTDSLLALSSRHGIDIIAPGALVRGKEAPSLSGAMSPTQAVDRLLANSGLQARQTPSGAIVIAQQETPPPQPSIQPEPASNPAAGMADAPLIADTLVISGTKRNLELQDTKASVAVLTGQVLDDSTITDLQQVLQRIPNVNEGSNGGFSIRGIPERGLGSGVGDTSLTTAIYIDGAVQSFSAGANGILSTWDVAQVEVFRGPQTTTQGRSALAGAIVIDTVDPTFDWTGRARASYGEFDTTQFSAAFGGPLIDEKLAFRVAADFTDTDGFTTFNDGTNEVKNAGQDRRDVLRGKLLFTPTDNLEAIFTVNYSDARRGTNQVSGPDLFDRITAEPVNIRDTEVISGSLEINYTLSDTLTISSVTAYSDLDQNTAPLEGTEGGVGTSTVGIVKEKGFTQEIRALYDSTGPISGILGFYFADLDERSERIITGEVLGSQLFLNDGFDNTFTNYAVFGEADIKLSDHWTLILGARHDIEDSNRSEFASSRTVPPLPFLPDGEGSFSGKSSFDTFLPKAGITYNFNDDVSLSFIAQRAYRPGGADIRPDTNEAIEFAPEFTWNYDLVFRSVFLDGRLTFNANLFYVDYTDMQVRFSPDPAVPFVRFIANAGEAELYGLEVEVTYQPIEPLTLYASIGVSEAELGEFLFQGQNLEGNEFPFTPPVSFSIGGTYSHASGVSVTVDTSYSDGYFSLLQNGDNLRVPSYFLVNLRIGYEADHWGIFAYARNLFDENYLITVNRDEANPALSNGTLGEPQNFGVVLEARF